MTRDESPVSKGDGKARKLAGQGRLAPGPRNRGGAERRFEHIPAGGAGGGRHRAGIWPIVAFVLAAAAVAAYVQLRSPNIPDPDAFYHMRHASLYATRGLWTSEFPWVAFSVIRLYAADQWYGFHVVLIPFTYLSDPLLQIKLAGVFILTTMLCLLWWALRRLSVVHAWLWPFVVLLVAEGSIWRLSLVRPHVLSAGISVALLSVLIRGSYRQVALASAALTFFHLSFFWLTPVVVLVFAGARWLPNRVVEWPKIAAAVAGSLCGWLLRPHPAGVAGLLYVQIFDLMAVKHGHVPLRFGEELAPAEAAVLVQAFWPLLLAWLCALGVFAWMTIFRRLRATDEHRTLLWCSLLLSIFFFELTSLLSRRSVDLWIPFAVTFVAALVTALARAWALDSRLWPSGHGRKALVAIGAAFIAFAFGLALHGTGRTMNQLASPYRLQGAGTWLRDHARPGAIVFNVLWDDFAELFFWNPNNRYIGGMDPIFQYAFDERRYWQAHHMVEGAPPGYTCAARECTPANREDVYTVLRRDFRAEYLVINKAWDAGLLNCLRLDPRFRVRYEDEDYAVAELVGPAPTPTAGQPTSSPAQDLLRQCPFDLGAGMQVRAMLANASAPGHRHAGLPRAGRHPLGGRPAQRLHDPGRHGAGESTACHSGQALCLRVCLFLRPAVSGNRQGALRPRGSTLPPSLPLGRAGARPPRQLAVTSFARCRIPPDEPPKNQRGRTHDTPTMG